VTEYLPFALYPNKPFKNSEHRSHKMQFSIFLSLFLFVSGLCATDSPPSPIRIAFFVTRSPNITEAKEFHYHWSTHHAPLVTPWLKRSGVIEYNQVSPSISPRSTISNNQPTPVSRSFILQSSDRASLRTRQSHWYLRRLCRIPSPERRDIPGCVQRPILCE
jgi:hypothetical protein